MAEFRHGCAEIMHNVANGLASLMSVKGFSSSVLSIMFLYERFSFM